MRNMVKQKKRRKTIRRIKKDKNKNRLTSKLTGEDLKEIANFHAIVRNYIKMSRLLKEINQ